jgi:hypothetical protein
MSNCHNQECTITPSYGLTDKLLISCKKHKSNDMINLSKICKFENCLINSSFGLIINKKQKYLRCKEHKEDDMIALYQKCLDDNCTERARYNFINEKGSKYCVKHKENSMVDKNKAICIIEDCITYASFKDPITNKNIYCTFHSKKENNENANSLISSKNKICKNENCKLLANFGTIEDGRQYCSNHKLDNMIDHHHERCKICNIFLMKHGNKICSFCNPLSNNKSNEKLLFDLFTTKQIKFIYNETISFDYLRPDFLIKQNNLNLIIECDEKQHKNYDNESEILRMKKIINYLENKTIFIRFNPDDYRINKKRVRININKKLNILLILINKIFDESKNENELNIANHKINNCYYLFYDCDCQNECDSIHSKFLE